MSSQPSHNSRDDIGKRPYGARTRPIRIDGDVAYVPLTKGYFAVIDAADAPLVEMFNWRAQVDTHNVYAIRTDGSGAKNRSIYMHRVIAPAPDGVLIDHKDNDGLNNRRSNLRRATDAQNNRNARLRRDNTSGYKGVSWHKYRRKWAGTIAVDGKPRCLGYFSTPQEAHAAYAKASAALHGEFGRVE